MIGYQIEELFLVIAASAAVIRSRLNRFTNSSMLSRLRNTSFGTIMSRLNLVQSVFPKLYVLGFASFLLKSGSGHHCTGLLRHSR